MIKFEKEAQKEWLISNGEQEILHLKLQSSSITNKFHIVTGFIERVSEYCGVDFDQWFVTLITEYVNHKDRRYPTMLNNIPQLKQFVDSYIDQCGVDFDSFIDMSKVKKNSIFFNAEEIREIARLSGYLKIYTLFFNSDNLKLSQRLHKKVYNKISEEILKTDIIRKIFEVIKTKTYKYSHTDKYMWDYIKMIQCKTIDVHVIEIFNFVMNSILVLCEEDRNPITYFIGVVDESVKWFLRSVYKGSIIYDDSISTEDIHGLNINNLKTYSYNDTLGRLKGIAFEQIYEDLENNSIITFDQEPDDRMIINFQTRVNEIQYISPLCECFVFPILSKITSIPYSHFRTLSPDHAAVLSVYVRNLAKKVFKGEFKNLISLLDYYPMNQPSIATSYTVKKVKDYLAINNKHQNFLGFNTKMLPHKMLSYFVGRISRISFSHITDGSKLPGIPLAKVEGDMINFYAVYFAGKLDRELNQMRKLMNQDF
ncbi:hypothetical protein KAR91_24890 [Candidatus Pacearchaeota archaeon]|nr:hypothetical protein [Candidatus Pacearchaeota archaeon]